MKYVYPFTNENLSSYQKLYNFDNSKVLTVLGSGDQYLSSLLYGAKEIEVYDYNFIAWDFFVLKYYGILILNYEEFYYYFVTKRLNDLNFFNKLLPYLPNDVVNRLEKLKKQYGSLSRLLFIDRFDDKYNNGNYIPYFSKEKYYQLQSLLINQKLPNFYLSNLQNLPHIVNNQSYDIILTSNIFDWLYKDIEIESVKKYKKILKGFNYGEIQALYCWNLSESFKQELEKNDFEIEQVPGVKTLSLTPDSVVSLRNK